MVPSLLAEEGLSTLTTTSADPAGFRWESSQQTEALPLPSGLSQQEPAAAKTIESP